jgi:hypothetical protein
METVRHFRMCLKTHIKTLEKEKSKQTKSESALIPTHATIFIASSHPSWKLFVIDHLNQLYLANNHSLPNFKELAKYFTDRSEIDEKYRKKLIPFVVFLRDSFDKKNEIISFDQHLSFNEYEILQINEDYLRCVLNIEEIEIHLIDINKPDVTNLENISPGNPCVTFRHEKSITIRLINRQPYLPYFEWSISVMNGDTIEKLEMRLRRHADRQLKTSRNIRIFYFQDSEVNTRILPNMATPFQGLVEFENKQQILQIDMEDRTVLLGAESIGNIFVYFVE